MRADTLCYVCIFSYLSIFCNLFLAHLAREYLAIPASQASCERLFSIAKHVVTEFRTRLLPDLVEALIFLSKGKDMMETI
jgi:hypothetical protein